MATDSRPKPQKARRRDPWRSPYRFSAEQVLKMVEAGILPEDGQVELWDGILYQMTKGELHNVITTGIADAIRRASPQGFHVREEKSCTYRENSLPEPDVAVCRGDFRSYHPRPPDLAQLVLVVEVDHSTKPAEQDERHRRYAEAGIPVYWQVGAGDRLVSVYRRPEATGPSAHYTSRESYGLTREIPILIDGQTLGRVAVADFFPVDPA